MARALLVPRSGFSIRRLPDVGHVRVLEQTIIDRRAAAC